MARRSPSRPAHGGEQGGAGIGLAQARLRSAPADGDDPLRDRARPRSKRSSPTPATAMNAACLATWSKPSAPTLRAEYSPMDSSVFTATPVSATSSSRSPARAAASARAAPGDAWPTPAPASSTASCPRCPCASGFFGASGRRRGSATMSTGPWAGWCRTAGRGLDPLRSDVAAVAGAEERGHARTSHRPKLTLQARHAFRRGRRERAPVEYAAHEACPCASASRS